ncbi:GxxExxY protein [Marinihelvus fidelis]|uniref:GxxExxY protein n=1 Tax=Marinihelvus fidelis TaxID=2613842 RepID=A0A5N0TCY9_9GAMM|nr:GxxExxY protein [Marinihelvus fidelis]KAA9132548.1 GxxExxY protein [Marinihelvus fidelis]
MGGTHNTTRLSYNVIGAAMAVHRALGCGFLESVYEHALVTELRHRGITHARQTSMTVRYRGELVGRFRADLVADNRLVIELKAAAAISPACQAQLLNYLRAAEMPVGLILNFGTPTLQIKRLANSVGPIATNGAGIRSEMSSKAPQIAQMTQRARNE